LNLIYIAFSRHLYSFEFVTFAKDSFMKPVLETVQKDWLYIILSPISGFLLVGFYFLMINLTSDLIAFFSTLFLYSVLFDLRHLFMTYTRTLFDKVFMESNRKWFITSWLLIHLIPLIFFFGLSMGEHMSYRSSIVLSFTSRMVFVLGFYHLVKQNWGFMAIYKNKLSENDPVVDRYEKLLLLSGSFLPLIWVAWQQPIWFSGEQIAFAPKPEEMDFVMAVWRHIGVGCLITSLIFLFVGFGLKVIPQYKYVSRNIGWLFFASFLMIRLVLHYGSEIVFQFIFSSALLLFFFGLIQTIRSAMKAAVFNTGKWAVLIASFILYNGIFLMPIEEKIIAVMAVTIPHNIQYLAFVSLINRKSFLLSTEDHGFAARLTKKLGLFIVLSVIYAILFEGLRSVVHTSPFFMSSETLYLIRNGIVILFIGMVLHHYYMDAVIWRVRKDKNLSKNI
jgi:hypothetical protein